MTNPSPPTSREQEALTLLEAAAKQEGWETINPEAPCWKASVAAIIAAVDAERERAAQVAEAERDYRRQCQALALKKSEAPDYESMAIACQHVAIAIRNPKGES